MKINQQQLLIKIAHNRKVQTQVYNQLNIRFKNAKNVLLSEFNNSDITKEIEAGPDLNTSSVLPNGYGNLFSFLGFSLEQRPIDEVRSLLLDNINLRNRPKVNPRSLVFTINIPSKSQIEAATPMKWESGRSWIHAVTYGLTGFSYYLFSLSKKMRSSRSGHAIQIKQPIRSSTAYFTGKGYLIGMIGNFRKRFTK